MVEITNIPFEDFPDHPSNTRSVSKTEWNAVRDLKRGEAIQFPCRWQHQTLNGYDVCTARGRVRTIGSRLKRELQASCVDKLLYVRRVH